MSNTLIPNTYQKPNMYSDVFDCYLTADESKTLDFFVRRILGFDEHRATRRDTISLTQIVDGIQKQDGTWITRGTGQSRPAVVKALHTLLAFGFIIRVGTATRIGQEYELVLDESKIDLDGLMARKDAAHAAGLKRTDQARLARLTDNDEETAVSQPNHERLATHTDSGKTDVPPAVSLANTQNPLSKPTLKTHIQKGESAAKNAAPAPLPFVPPPSKSPPVKADKPPRNKTQRVAANGHIARTPEEHALCEELVDGLSEVSGMLRQTNRATLYDGGWQIVGLQEAGITPSKAHILKAFGQRDPGPGAWWWYRDDQRVKMDKAKGLAAPMPKPRQVAEMYSVSLVPLVVTNSSNGHARAAPAREVDGIGALRARLRGETPAEPGVIEGRVIDGNRRRNP